MPPPAPPPYRPAATLTLVAFALAAPLAAPAEDRPTPSVRAPRLAESEKIRIDGRLDEAVWRAAPAATEFRQREPQEGRPASEATEVRVVYDTKNLHVGILARDSAPRQVIGRTLQRDQLVQQGMGGEHQFVGDDVLGILLDPFLDGRNAFVFATNPNGAELEALLTDERATLNLDWRTVWRVAAARNDEGWAAEIALPFRSLRYPSGDGEQAWGFNVVRVIRRKNEEVLWSSWERSEGGFHRVSRAGRIQGLTDLPRPGLNLEVKPYALLGALTETDEDAAHPETRALTSLSLDAKWQARSGLVLDGTPHPDFAQVEADQERVNLTSFDLFFPEKREFFLENAGIFDFGVNDLFGGPPPFLLFMSRAIGIKDEGPVPLLGGLRLSGRTGRQTVGLLSVATGEAAGDPVTSLNVARVKRDLGARHYLGLALTDRRNERDSNTVAGLDRSFWLTPTLNLQGFATRSTTSGPGGDDWAYRIGLESSGDRVGFSVDHLLVGPEMNAEMGFILRKDIRRTAGYGHLRLRPRWADVRRIDLMAGGTYVARVDGRHQDHEGGPAVFIEWNSGDRLVAWHFRGANQLDEAFDLWDRVPVPVGRYDLDYTGFALASSEKRALSIAVESNFMNA
jgi:hypothetical protein